VYLDGIDITKLCEISGTVVTISNISPGSTVYITIHMDFGEKGNNYASLSDFVLQGYIFNTVVTGSGGTPSLPGEGLFATHYSSSNLIGHQKKAKGICGFVTDADGNPVEGITVLLLDPEGNQVDSTTTDPNGFYFFRNLELLAYKIQIISVGPPIPPIDAIIVKNKFVEINFFRIEV